MLVPLRQPTAESADLPCVGRLEIWAGRHQDREGKQTAAGRRGAWRAHGFHNGIYGGAVGRWNLWCPFLGALMQGVSDKQERWTEWGYEGLGQLRLTRPRTGGESQWMSEAGRGCPCAAKRLAASVPDTHTPVRWYIALAPMGRGEASELHHHLP